MAAERVSNFQNLPLLFDSKNCISGSSAAACAKARALSQNSTAVQRMVNGSLSPRTTCSSQRNFSSDTYIVNDIKAEFANK